MKIRNLTPHPLNFREVYDGATITFTPATHPARVSVEIVYNGLRIDDIPVTENTYGEVENLPNEYAEPDTIYIVSMLVAQACPGRKDLYIVNETVRNENGHIIGARSIAQNPF